MTKGSFNSELYAFAFWPDYENSIRYLAENLADKEDWDFSDTKIPSYSILKSYLEFTFRRLRHEAKVCFKPDNKYACFNTGLVTSNLEDIYAYFEEYNKPKPGSSPYCFKAFLKKSDNTLLRNFGTNLPDVANYFQKPEMLIFNPKCNLIPDIDHIINDNIKRFPAHLQAADSAELLRQLYGAIEEVKKKVRTNYTLAVPQFYNGRVQLLLPLCLTPHSPNPDLALVITQLDSGNYTARTCLTLKMAYNNARLIVKPQSNWLKT